MSAQVRYLCSVFQIRTILLTSAQTFGNNPLPATTSLVPAANAQLLNNMMDLSRTVAMGLRVYPMIPATSVPGVVTMGCAPRCDLADIVAKNNITAAGSGVLNTPISNQAGLPWMREHLARPSSLDFFQTTWRPTDVRDFEFTPGDSAIIGRQTGSATLAPFYDISSNANGDTGRQDDTGGSFIGFTAQGCPASTGFYFEVVLHLECTASAKTQANSENFSSRPSLDVASEGVFSSMETLYRAIAPYLPNVDTVSGAATSLLSSPIVREAASRYLRGRIVGVRSSGYELV